MRSFLLVVFIFCVKSSFGQQFTISGTVVDENTGEHLIGASLYDVSSRLGTTSNAYGFYSLSLPQDSVRIRTSYVGYQPKTLTFYLSRDTTLSIQLVSGQHLQEVEVVGSREERPHESTRMGTNDISIDQIKAMPVLLGEVDVLKALQLLPGVQSGSEGSSGLYVRGGGPDQNLILLDGVPVYNAAHLFGFFSVFNADAINHVELTKGGFPARYGGRLSSVIDISMKEGNTKKVQAEGAIGFVASRLTIDGPINRTTSFIVSARRTYIDLVTKPFREKKGNTQGYYFYDLNLKVNHTFNEKNRLYLSAYTGDDKGYQRTKTVYHNNSLHVESSEGFSLRWGNITTALRWNKIINNKLFGNVTATYSQYRFRTQESRSVETVRSDSITMPHYHLEYTSGIRDFAIKADFDYRPNPRHFVRFGTQVIDHQFAPGVVSYDNSRDGTGRLGAKKNYTLEYSAYIEDDVLLSEVLKMNAGIHASAFSVERKFYRSVQPRLSVRYLLSPDISVKASFAQMTQYIHLLSNVGIGLPTDLWVPSTRSIEPERSVQVAMGGTYALDPEYELSVEGYFKDMQGLIEYQDGASYLNVETDWQTKVETGSGKSYGMEIFLQKKTGKLKGWFGYTLSRTTRQFDNLNEGMPFPYRYDRRHDIEITTTYNIKPERALGLTWVYGTGAAVTLPRSSYLENDGGQSSWMPPLEIKYYDERNGYRMRAYHRLDLSYTASKKKRWGERSWVIGVYNAYSRRNPFFLDLSTDAGGNKKFIQFSLFPIIPSVSYRFKF